jgi:integrase
MSTFKRPGAQVYSYDFWIEGRRFSGRTEATTKKEADAVEKKLKARAKDDIETEKRTGQGPMTLRHACGKYWEEVGKFDKDDAKLYADFKRLVDRLGPDKRLDEIDDAEVAALVAWRRGQAVWGREKRKDGRPNRLVGPATVNRSVTHRLCMLLTRARKIWRVALPREPDWAFHRLPEPEGRVRELSAEEETRLFAALREDYVPWITFALLTALRLEETIIRWANVNREAKQITTIGKGGRPVSTPITPAIAAILDACEGHDEEFVFTYVARQTRDHIVRGRRHVRVKGKRYPLTAKGGKSIWNRVVKAARLVDFRFHDLRHTAASRLLRESKNLKLVQRALNHRSVNSTARYAHVLDADVADALQRVAESREKSHAAGRRAARR